MKLSPRNTLLVTALGVALVIVALAGVLVVPQFSRISTLDGELAQAEQESESARFLLEQRREVRDRAAVTDAKLMQLSTAFPEDPELTSVIIEMQDLAYDVEVDLRAVEPQTVIIEGDGTYLSVPITIEFLGEWAECVDYLDKLTKLSRQLRVVEFTAVPVDPSDITDIDLDLDTYATQVSATVEVYSVPKAEMSSSAPPAPEPTQ